MNLPSLRLYKTATPPTTTPTTPAATTRTPPVARAPAAPPVDDELFTAVELVGMFSNPAVIVTGMPV